MSISINEVITRFQETAEKQIKTMLNMVGINTDGVDASNIEKFYNKLSKDGYEMLHISEPGLFDQKYCIKKDGKELASFLVKMDYESNSIEITPVVLSTEV